MALFGARGDAPAPADASSPGVRGSVYWGLQVGAHITGGEAPYDLRALRIAERRVGKRTSLVSWSLPWRSCRSGRCRDVRFPRVQMQRVRDHGAIPVFGWASYAQPLRRDQSAFRLDRIARGEHDRFIRAWARAAADWGHPFFLRFNWEMNVRGIWPYASGGTGNTPGDFVRAWKRVHDLFVLEGASNATWVWCPNIAYPGSTPLRELYPGDAYVDWTCLDGYNWPRPTGNGRRSFTDLFAASYDALVRDIAPRRPVMIGETATTGRTGIKGRWIDELFTALPARFPRIRALVYFNKNDDEADWPLERSRAGTAAFRRGVAAPRYLPGTFAGLRAPGGPIAAP
jgi:hypothetical protein